MELGLLIAVTAVLFIRPTDLAEALASIPLYNIAIVSCIVGSLNLLNHQLQSLSLKRNPVGALMVGFLGVSVLSNLANGQVDNVLQFGIEYAKCLVLLLLVVGIVDSPQRLRTYLASLVIISLIPTVLATLHFDHYIYIAGYDAESRLIEKFGHLAKEVDATTGVITENRRLRGSGFFDDPNDFCEVLNPAILSCLMLLTTRGGGLPRFVWLVPLSIFGYALTLTQSRGGLLGTLTGVGVLMWGRLGLRKTLLFLAPGLLLLFVYLGGRQLSLDASGGSGQQRIQVWVDGFLTMRQSPILGVGTEQFVEYVGKASHNAFIGAYTETGLIGGTLFFGMYFCVIGSLVEVARNRRLIQDPALSDLIPVVAAIVASYAMSELTLTHPYAVPTYLVLGVGTACIHMAEADLGLDTRWLAKSGLIRRMILSSLMFVTALYFYAMLAVRYR